MLEWYRAGEPYEALMADCAALLAAAAQAAGGRRARLARPRRPIRSAEPGAADGRRGVRRATPASTSLATASATATRSLSPRRRAGIRIAADDTWSDIFSRVLVEKVEPQLGLGRPTHPLRISGQPRRRWRGAKPDDPRVAERFELYACGVELANGFGELTDAAEQRRRFEAEMDEKERIYGERYPHRRGLPGRARARCREASGVALGFDRLVMLATGAPRIDHVQWTPVDDRRGA